MQSIFNKFETECVFVLEFGAVSNLILSLQHFLALPETPDLFFSQQLPLPFAAHSPRAPHPENPRVNSKLDLPAAKCKGL